MFAFSSAEALCICSFMVSLAVFFVDVPGKNEVLILFYLQSRDLGLLLRFTVMNHWSRFTLLRILWSCEFNQTVSQ